MIKQGLTAALLTTLLSGCMGGEAVERLATGNIGSGGDLSGNFGKASDPVTPATHMRPPADFTGQWYTTSNGCSYSRAEAPGYGVSWHLILNPHHIGKPNAHKGCPRML